MSKEADAYALVIEDLKRQREEIDRTIAMLEARVSGGPPPARPAAKPEPDKESDHTEETGDDPHSNNEGEFLGKTVADAAKVVLNRRRKPMSPSAITAELERGGLPVASSRTIASVLHRRSREVGDFVSPKRGLWGLKEWYPRRNFAGRLEMSDKGGPTEPSEPEQPSEPTLIVPLRTNGEP